MNMKIIDIDIETVWADWYNKYQWVRDMRGVPQDPIFHGEGDVEIHTKMVIEALVKLPEYQNLSFDDQQTLLMSALFHDVEKRSTTVHESDGRITSNGHAKKGEFTARSVMYKEFNYSFEQREQICKLVRYHGLPLWALEKENPQKAVIEASLTCRMDLLAILSTADVLGRICPDKEELLLKIELFKELCKENDCYYHKKEFSTDLARFEFLNKDECSVEYVPFDDKQFTVYVLCGLPGAGKDTYIKNNLRDLPVVSIDDIRRANKIKHNDSKGNGQAIQLAHEEARKYMRKKESFIWNATNITKDLRSKITSLFLEYGAKIKMIYLEVPYKTLIKQNNNREYPIPNDAIEKLITKVELPSYKEAHEIEFIVK